MRADKHSDPILSRLWTEVHEIFRDVGDLLIVSNAFFSIFYVMFRSEDIGHKVSKSSKNGTNVKLFGPSFWEGQPRLFTAVC